MPDISFAHGFCHRYVRLMARRIVVDDPLIDIVTTL
jgi:hypothetical protein